MTSRAEKVESIRSGKPVKAGDYILFAVLALLVIALFAAVYAAEKDGETVEIYYKNTLFGQYNLAEDREIEVDGHLRVVIKDGVVYATDSDCRDHICEKTVISKAGRQIICLPNEILVLITGEPLTDIILG